MLVNANPTRKNLNTVRGKAEFILRLNTSKDKCLVGKIEHISSGQVQYFDNLLQMIKLLHHKMEDLDSPQSTTVLRSWK